METEKDEASTKRHDNTFSLQNIIFTVKVSAVIAVSGYWGYPNIVNLLEGVNLWFHWFRLVLRNIFFVFIILNALIGSIYFIFLKTTGKKKQDLYDEYIAAVPSVVRPSPEPCFAPMEVGDYGGGYYNNSSYEDTVPPFQAVNTVEESSCYEQVVMETSSKSYRRTTRSEKKMRSRVEYQRTESERVMKTASCRLAIDELSSEEFRMTVETFIMHNKKKMYYWPNGVADNLQNGVPQFQNGGVDQWQNGFPQLQNGFVDQWPNAVVPQLQNGGVDQWQRQADYDGTGRHRHRSRRRRVADGSGSTGSGGPYLAISN